MAKRRKTIERSVIKTKSGTGWALKKVLIPKERFKKGAMISIPSGKRSTFVTTKPRPDVRLVIGCLPRDFDAKRGICLRTTVHKQIKQITAAEARKLSGRKLRKAVNSRPIKKAVSKARKAVETARKAVKAVRRVRKISEAVRTARALAKLRRTIKTLGAHTAALLAMERKARRTKVKVRKKKSGGNPQLLLITNPCPKAIRPATEREIAKTNRAYKRFHFTNPATQMTADVPKGFPRAYMVIGELERFDCKMPSGRIISRRYGSSSPRPVLCTTSAMKDLYIFDVRILNIPAGVAIRCDYRVPAHSGRNKWARRWWHPHDTTPYVRPDISGKAVRISGRGLSVRPEGIVG